MGFCRPGLIRLNMYVDILWNIGLCTISNSSEHLQLQTAFDKGTKILEKTEQTFAARRLLGICEDWKMMFTQRSLEELE